MKENIIKSWCKSYEITSRYSLMEYWMYLLKIWSRAELWRERIGSRLCRCEQLCWNVYSHSGEAKRFTPMRESNRRRLVGLANRQTNHWASVRVRRAWEQCARHSPGIWYTWRHPHFHLRFICVTARP